jgi:glycerophosphoryl diester phosphodiesterase
VSPTLYAAHRGGAALWPENSLLAFRRAIAMGAPLVECDVHLTADGELAVIHDRTLDRTTEGRGPVAERTAAELGALRLRASGAGIPDRSDDALTDERIPMLDQLLGLLAPSPVRLLLEVKEPGTFAACERRDGRLAIIGGRRYEGLEGRVLHALDRHDMRGRTTVMAFNPDVIREVRGAAPSQRTTLLFARRQLDAAGATAVEALELAAAIGATDVGVEHSLADTALVAAARARGLGLGVWTVNDSFLMRRYADLGVDLITTDRPDIAQQVLGRPERPITGASPSS